MKKLKKLSQVEVGDFVVIATGMREQTVIYPVVNVSGGRVFTSDVVRFRKNWRFGYNIATGKQGVAGSRRCMIRVASEEEVQEHLAAEKRSAEQTEAYKARQARPEAQDASFILSHTEEQLIEKLTPAELHVLAAQLRK